MNRTISTRGHLWQTAVWIALLLRASAPNVLHGQTFSSLLSFDGANGEWPYAGLVQGIDGSFYGTTSGGGANAEGTVFKIAPNGSLTTLYSFCAQVACLDGAVPETGLVQGTDGNFYGTTYNGGGNSSCFFGSGCGELFKITPAGAFSVLYSFCSQTGCADGEYPSGGLVQAANGDLYGTTLNGGSDVTDCASGCGTIFKITLEGSFTTLHSFSGTDGGYPNTSLFQAANGNLYGTTEIGGSANFGTVFLITPDGALTTLYTFLDEGDGASPGAGLIQATDGFFYGSTSSGGSGGGGTIFRMTPTGALTTLHSFCTQKGCSDGESPQAPLLQATDGALYGTDILSGKLLPGGGTIFKITTAGEFTTLYEFCSRSPCPNGKESRGALIQAPNGKFYGTTEEGGTNDDGIVYSFSVGLAPFVITEPSAGMVGAAVHILGTSLTDTTSVTFNGTRALFNVISTSEIVAQVPAGATSGIIEVVTPSGTLSSSKPFLVQP